MEKFANALAETFMEKYPNVTVQAEFTGSSAVSSPYWQVSVMSVILPER